MLRLKQPNDVDLFNIGSGKQLLDVLKQRNKLDESKLLLTDNGNQSASKESLAGAMTDRLLQENLGNAIRPKTFQPILNPKF